MKKYFRRLPLRLKLLLIGVIPITVIFYLGTQYYAEKQQRLSNLRVAIERIKLNGQIAALISELQSERKLSFDKLMGSSNDTALQQQRVQTDSTMKVLNRSQDFSITGYTAFANLQDLQRIRILTDTQQSHTDVVTDFYLSAIFRLNTLTVVNVNRSGRLQVVYDNLKSHILLAQLISYLYIIQSNVYNVVYTKRFMTETLIGTYGTYKVYNSYEKEFYMKGSAEAIQQYKSLLLQPDLKATKAFIDKTFATFKFDSTYTADGWWRVSSSGVQSLKNLEQQLWKNILNQTDEIYKSYETDKKVALVIMIALLVVTVGIVLYTSIIISHMLSDLKHKAQQIANGESNIVFADFSKDEIGGLAAAIQQMDENQTLLAQAADQIGKGNFKTTVRPRSKADILGIAIVEMQAGLQTFSEKMEALVKERTGQLESSNADLQQFAHVASHDLKEPLRKIQYFNSRLSDDY